MTCCFSVKEKPSASRRNKKVTFLTCVLTEAQTDNPTAAAATSTRSQGQSLTGNPLASIQMSSDQLKAWEGPLVEAPNIRKEQRKRRISEQGRKSMALW